MSLRPDKSKVRSLRDLPQDLLPARDLWAGIKPHLEDNRIAGAARWRMWAPPMALAASVLLVVAGVWISANMRSEAPVQAMSGSAVILPAAFVQDPEYLRQREALLRELPAKLEQLPPESRQHIKESLQSIQQAIATIETELGRDAGNALLQELLINTSQEEMRVLTDAGMADGMNGRT
jgi:negative regulator of sigma E activity